LDHGTFVLQTSNLYLFTSSQKHTVFCFDGTRWRRTCLIWLLFSPVNHPLPERN